MAARVAFFLGVALVFGNIFANSDGELPVEFGYSGRLGPENWGRLSPLFRNCSEGKSQSPVNIVTDEAVPNKNLKPLRRFYSAGANATLVDGGPYIEVKFESNSGWLIVEGKNYTLEQMHWHSPSEHTIDGKRYPVELHLVHKTSEGDITVIGILFRYGGEDPILKKLQKSLKRLAEEGAGDEKAQVPLGVIDTKHLRRKTRKYYRYVGSLTTPPCWENVIWNILHKVRKISKEQVAALKAPLERDFWKNSRPIQPLNGRKIELYRELN
ncbi:Alpha carbonic anhydrase domain [Dillenia turbinata]|uniref:Carbonic anhydrase n=1 Tax=Dillenia turbinata TaxID=194707 RepID=A0AAN8ZSL7_9MAGN